MTSVGVTSIPHRRKLVIPPPRSPETPVALTLRLGLQAALNDVQIIEWGPAEILVQSQDDPTTWYTVAPAARTCTCPGKSGPECAHRALVTLLGLPASDEVAHCPACRKVVAFYVPVAGIGAVRCPHCHWAADLPADVALDVYATLTGQTDLLLNLDDVLVQLAPVAPALAQRAARAAQAGRDLFGPDWRAA
jgi:hypothetical protein